MVKKYLLFATSVLAAAGFLLWRVCLIGTCIEPLNGFFYPNANNFRYYFILGFVLLFALVLILAFTDKNMPKVAITSSKTLGAVNILYSLAVLLQCGILFKSENDKWDNIYVIACLILAIFMIYYAVCMFTGKAVSKSSALIPLLVFVYRLGYIFVNSFGILKSSEVVLNIFALIFCILFFECFARYNSNFKFNFIRKPLLAFGVLAPVVMLTSALGGILAPKFFAIDARVVSSDSLLIIATAVYIFIYTVVIFSRKSTYKNN